MQWRPWSQLWGHPDGLQGLSKPSFSSTEFRLWQGWGRSLRAAKHVLEDFETPPQRQERFDFMGLKVCLDCLQHA